MNAVADSLPEKMRALVVLEMGDRKPGETYDRCFERAATALGITHSLVWRLWHRRAKRIDDRQYEEARKRALENERHRLVQLRQEIAEREKRIAQMEGETRADVAAYLRRVAGR